MRNIVQKYSNGTALIKNAVLNTDGNAPDPRISMGFGVGENGEIRHYNNPNDPMPIKTINMAGLQKWEETDDYIIYVDKDAVETLVENYQVGAYDLFLERKTNVDNSMELLKENGIEWTSSDDSMLMLDVNEQLYRKSLLRDSVDMLPGDIEVQSTTRAVPTTYECCFRTDKKTGEIYIGEGYENLVGSITTDMLKKEPSSNESWEVSRNNHEYLLKKLLSDRNNLVRSQFSSFIPSITDTVYSFTIRVKTNQDRFFIKAVGAGEIWCRINSDLSYKEEGQVEIKKISKEIGYINVEFIFKTLFYNSSSSFFSVLPQSKEVDVIDVGAELMLNVAQITKTSTPKPFVKSVMPSGKLSFVTGDVRNTHSIILKYKDVRTVNNECPIIFNETSNEPRITFYGTKKTDGEHRSAVYFGENGTNPKIVDSNFNKLNSSINYVASNKYTAVNLRGYDYMHTQVVKQLLIYKGNLTESELKAENEKEIKLERLYSLDDQVSLNFKCDENGLQYYNNPNDPMPIKTINMAGLQKWEETDDYIIYVDKDAVMTTVQNYVTGTYDLFLERKSQVDGAMELLKENGIEWTSEDDSKLLQDINLVQLEKMVSMPTTLEEDSEPHTFETRAVPTTYECCFRTDKKTGEIYIGEGYENRMFLDEINLSKAGTVFDLVEKDGYISFKTNEVIGGGDQFEIIFEKNVTDNPYVSVVFDAKASEIGIEFVYRKVSIPKKLTGVVSNGEWQHITKTFETNSTTSSATCFGGYNPKKETKIEFKNLQVTKTSTPKPFVKSVMPSGKLSFVTNATSETHSFLAKDNKNFFESEVASFSLIAQSNPSISIEQKEKVIWIGDDE